MEALKSIVCLNCGGEVTLSTDGKEATCKYCRRTYRIGSTLKDSALIAFSQATEYWKTFRFTDAKRKFSEVTKENPEFSEAWWGAFVSEYGIEFGYNRFGDKVPTCHRAHMVNVSDNPNYIKAVETADEVNKEEYISLGNEIERIRAEIIKRSEDGENYDIFICFKATEINAPGKKTDDYYLGQDIYHELKREGYNVFFSAETLARIGEQEFEPYIFKALSTAKVMLVLCSDNEKIESAWVKNEWGRFIDMHGGKGLIPVCGNNGVKYTPYELPEELRKLNAIEYDGKLFEKLKTKIEAYFPERVKARTEAEKKAREAEYEAKFAKEREAERQAQEEQLKKQQEQVERLINKASETEKKKNELVEKYNAAKAAMLLAESEWDYKNAAKLFGDIVEYNDANLLRAECLEKAKKAKYDRIISDAKREMKRGKMLGYRKAIKLLESIGDYENAEELISKCRSKIYDIEEKRKKALIITAIVSALAVVIVIIGVNIVSLQSRNGIKFTLNDDGESYTAKGINLFYLNTENLIIPSTYKGKPVTAIKSDSFSEKAEMESKIYRGMHNRKRKISITIPSSVTSIGDRAFANCTGLEAINYYGTYEEWESISKGFDWDVNTGNYTVNCTEK